MNQKNEVKLDTKTISNLFFEQIKTLSIKSCIENNFNGLSFENNRCAL